MLNWPEKSYGLFYQRHINTRIMTRSVRTVVDYAEHRNGVDVLNAECQVALACNCNYSGRPEIFYLATRKGSAIDHLYLESIFFSNVDQITNRAPTALLAVVCGAGNLAVADINLETMGKQHEDPVAGDSFTLGFSECVVDLDKGGS